MSLRLKTVRNRSWESKMGKNSKKLTPRKKKAHGGDPKEQDPTSLPKENAVPERSSGVFNFMVGKKVYEHSQGHSHYVS